MTDLRDNTSASLGIRNNNPGNLRDSGIAWKGRIGSNKGFTVFSSVEYGIRAMATDLKSKINRGENTLNKYIPIYSPPSENDTTSYINNVATQTGFGADQKLFTDRNTLRSLVRAHINVENGFPSANLITDQMIEDGLDMVGGISPIAAASIGVVLVIGVLIGMIYFLNK